MTGEDVITFIRQHPGEVANALLREHRTHQQSTVKSVYEILKSYAKAFMEFKPDLRNEAAVGWARKVTAEETYFPFL